MRADKILEIALLLLGLYVIFQIIKKLLGGSWATEDIILSLLVFNLGCTFTIGLMLAQMKADQSHLRDQFKIVSSDFKEHMKQA